MSDESNEYIGYNTQHYWTQAEMNLLEHNWLAGASATKIAAIINAAAVEPWCNRNKVIGKANRMGLSVHDSRSQPVSSRWSGEGVALRPPTVCDLPPAPGDRYCQYITGDIETEIEYCGKPVHDGTHRPSSSYCLWHHELCYKARDAEDKEPVYTTGDRDMGVPEQEYDDESPIHPEG